MSAPPEPRLRPTSPATLFVVALAAAATAWVLIGEFYGEVPPLTWLPALTLLLLAVLEAIAARAIKARIDRRPGTEPVDPLVVTRLVLLAKASSVAGALFTGLYGGVLVWLWAASSRNEHAAADMAPAAQGLGAALLLVGAALWLERCCRIPEPPPDREDESMDG
ncbi:MAG: DUF3180 family protein [Micromonosporaceae bacterium]|nr:DUF3180 family protein [Micromonosporaceae bacterium]